MNEILIAWPNITPKKIGEKMKKTTEKPKNDEIFPTYLNDEYEYE